MWLLQASIRQAIQQAQRSGVLPTAEQQTKFEARFDRFDEEGTRQNRILTIAGNNAEIAIEGVLTKGPDFYAMLFGGGNTTYPEIISALAEADQNDEVTSAVMVMDSPGGHVSGLFDALAAIENFSKPLTVRVTGTAQSAAYALAARAGDITASNRAVSFGSIGIAAEFYVDENHVAITSTAAPNKRPDVSTAAGAAVIREELDEVHQLFAETIAAGRNSTVENVNAHFGQGATMLADAALKRGMIDTIASVKLKAVKTSTPTHTTASGGNTPETDIMDLATLKSSHPAVYAAAREEGIQHGTTQERERSAAHLIMGEASGDMKTALTACKDGTEMTPTMSAMYSAAGMNRNDRDNRTADDIAASAADTVDDTTPAGEATSVADLVATRLGYTEE